MTPEKQSFDDELAEGASLVLEHLLTEGGDTRAALARGAYTVALQLSFLTESGLLPDYNEWVNGKLVDRYLGQSFGQTG